MASDIHSLTPSASSDAVTRVAVAGGMVRTDPAPECAGVMAARERLEPEGGHRDGGVGPSTERRDRPERRPLRHPGGITTDKTLRRDLERSLEARGVKVKRQKRARGVVVRLSERRQ
jgi:hypothetical protein